MHDKFDLIVIGAGNAGLTAAMKARKSGLKVALAEHNGIGGTCPLRGCVPKKVLVTASELLEKIQRARDHQIEVNNPTLNWSGLIERELSFTEGVSESNFNSLQQREIQLLRGHAKFSDPQTINVNGINYETEHTMIATGSRPRPLPFAGANYLLDSSQFLQMKERPKSAIFVGGGVIAMEFAHILARAGTEVTILEIEDRLLPFHEQGLVEKLTQINQELKINTYTQSEVKEIDHQGQDYQVQAVINGRNATLVADKVFHGAGRVPNIHHLNLSAAGIEYSDKGILVDNYLRSISQASIFAIGDAIASKQLSPVATYEGKIAVHNMLHQNDQKNPDYFSIPSCLHTTPALASVGYTEKDALHDRLDYELHEHDTTKWTSSRLYAEQLSYAKILVDKQTDKILGAHLLGNRAEEVINLFALAIKKEIKATELKEMVYAYPTFCSDIPHLL